MREKNLFFSPIACIDITRKIKINANKNNWVSQKNKISPRIKIIRFELFVNHFSANFFWGIYLTKKRG